MGRSHKTIGLISSVAFESALIKRTASSVKNLSPGIWAGKLKGRSVVHVTSGVGIANAAWAATVLMERFGAGLCLNLGIAGAYPSSGLVPGDVAVASEEVYADTGLALAGGCKGMQEMGIPLLMRGSTRRYNAFPMDTPLTRRAARAAVEAGYPVVIGRFLTVAQATGTLKRAKELERRHKAVVENMEGAAVAHVCARYGVKAVQIRGISNIVEKRDPGKWKKDLAARASQESALAFILALP